MSGTPVTTGTKEPVKIDLNTVINKIIEHFKPALPYITMIIFVVFILTLFSVASFSKKDVVFLTKYRYIMMIVLPFPSLIIFFSNPRMKDCTILYLDENKLWSKK